MLKTGKRIHPVETVRAKTVDDVLKQFEKWVEDVPRGLVRQWRNFKIKPRSPSMWPSGFHRGSEDRGMVHMLCLMPGQQLPHPGPGRRWREAQRSQDRPWRAITRS